MKNTLCTCTDRYMELQVKNTRKNTDNEPKSKPCSKHRKKKTPQACWNCDNFNELLSYVLQMGMKWSSEPGGSGAIMPDDNIPCFTGSCSVSACVNM